MSTQVDFLDNFITPSEVVETDAAEGIPEEAE